MWKLNRFKDQQKKINDFYAKKYLVFLFQFHFNPCHLNRFSYFMQSFAICICTINKESQFIKISNNTKLKLRYPGYNCSCLLLN